MQGLLAAHSINRQYMASVFREVMTFRVCHVFATLFQLVMLVRGWSIPRLDEVNVFLFCLTVRALIVQRVLLCIGGITFLKIFWFTERSTAVESPMPQIPPMVITGTFRLKGTRKVIKGVIYLSFLVCIFSKICPPFL